jgi:transposase
MSTVHRVNRKATDADIIRLNSVGMSLSSIAKELSVHPSTVTLRLQQLNVPPADTRRTFMEDIYKSLSSAQQDWLVDQLGPHLSIKDFVRNMLVEKYVATQGN